MNKLKIHELAKELNVASKRLMEKLEEIGIHPKSHMSTLEDDELDRLYKHIGIVNRNKQDASANNDNDAKADHADSASRKNAPRIIRKTEVVVRDDYVVDDQKDKKKNDKRSFIRSSDSNDGLMAGYTRGRENVIANVKKKPRPADEPRVQPEEKRPEPVDIIENIHLAEKMKKPVDDILGVKKVSHKVEKTESEEHGSVVEQENMQKENTIAVDKAPTEVKAEIDPPKAAKADIAEPAAETQPKAVEKPEAIPEIETKKVETARPAQVARPEYQDRSQQRSDRPPLQPRQDRPQGQDGRPDYRPRNNGDFRQDNRPDYRQDNRPDYRQDNRPDYRQDNRPDGQRRQGGDFNRQDRPQGDYNRPQGDYPRRNDGPRGEWKPREGGAPQGDYPRRNDGPRGEWKPREGGAPQGDYPRRNDGPRGEWKPREGGAPQGDYPRRNDGPRGEWKPREGGAPQGDYPRRNDGPRGEWKPREGGAPHNDYPRRNDGPRGEWKPREGGGAPRGDWKPGEGRPQYGDKDGKPEFRGRSDNRYPDRRDDRGPGGRNRPLVIPKVAAPTGATEEKVFTRGERREFVSVERKKEEKKEQKKEVVRSTNAAGDKGDSIRKKIDTVVGHKANVSDMMSDDFVIDVFYDDADEAIKAKRAEKRLKKGRMEKEKYIPPKAVLTDITIPDNITVKDLAEALKKTVADVIKKLFVMGVTATQNQELDYETASIVADEYNVKVHRAVVVSEEDILFDDTGDTDDNLKPRPPVVVVMGHVDHGKTSLLDAIRSANIAEKEAGGITQHIGAYTVNLHGRDITFLDTPGHEAFTAMRARGAKVTDIAILVVAADDGVMPQTIEAINHAKAAGVAIIVAINKIDKPNANPDRVKQELTQHGILIEEWGGDVIAVPVSAKQHVNIDQLLEMVLLTADVLELKSNPDKQAKGTVIEALLDKNKGPVATLLVQRGTLKVGDAILTGSTFGRIRSMVSDKGKKIKEAGPSIPVEIFGLSEVPEAGDLFYTVTDEKTAKQLAEKRKQQTREKTIGGGRAKITLEDLFSQIQQGNVKDLNLIIKADVQGSVEAIKQSMEKLSNDEVKVKVIHGAVGAIIEADVTLAEVSNAIIIGFNVRPGPNVMEAAQNAGVDLKLYRVIYDALNDIQAAMKGMLKPTFKEVVDGHIEIRQLFKVSNVGTIGGAYVLDGKIIRSSDIRLVRDGIVILEGKLASLKRFKDDVKEVAAGYECGVMLEKYNDIKEGDIIEAFHMEEVQRQ